MDETFTPSRRAFLRGSAAMAAGPIEFEKHVVRRNVEWLTASPISSINFTPIHALDGTITPQGCAFERHHSGAIELSKTDYRLMINGLVDKPLVFTYEDIERFPRENHVYFCECAANTERCPVYTRYDPQYGIYRCAASDPSARGRRRHVARQMGLCRGCRCALSSRAGKATCGSSGSAGSKLWTGLLKAAKRLRNIRMFTKTE